MWHPHDLRQGWVVINMIFKQHLSSIKQPFQGLAHLRFSCLHVEEGVIRNTYNIDLDRNPELAETLLVVRAYDMLHPTDSATITVNITIQQRNLQGPECSPAIYV